MWTGDSQTNFDEVPLSINMLLTLGVSGVVFGGTDVPGFFGVPVDDLWVQFYQLGVFYPFFRAHADKCCTVREPWLQSTRVQEVILDAIHQRYAQIHYLYTTFEEAASQGTPIMRPMWEEFPKDTATFGLQKQFMFGSDFLVAPKMDSQPTAITPVDVYLPPSEDWYNFYSKQVSSSGNQQLQLSDSEQGTFIRAGSIIPILNFDKSRMSLLAALKDPLRLDVYPKPADNQADGLLYLDDGKSFGFEKGRRTKVNYAFDGTTLTVTKVLNDSNYFAKGSKTRVTQVNVYGVTQEPVQVINRYLSDAPGQGTVTATFEYNASDQELRIHDIDLPVDANLTYNVAVDLI